jgi:hypothetical protein
MKTPCCHAAVMGWTCTCTTVETTKVGNMKLKPCPFCGGEAGLVIAMGEYWCICERCCAGSKMAVSKKEAARLWNKRYEPTEKKGG